MSTQIEGGNWYQECQQLRAQLAEAQRERERQHNLKDACEIDLQSAHDQLQSQAAQLAEWKSFGEHILAMDALTPGGSNEGWCKRLLNGELG